MSKSMLMDLVRELQGRLGALAAAQNGQEAEAGDARGEARLRDFADAASDWFWEMDGNLRFTYFSERFTEITGVPPESLLGRTREETGVPGVDPAAWRQHLSDLAAHRSFRDFRHPRSLPSGETVHLSINGKAIFDEHGTFKGYRGSGSDITERVTAGQALRQSQAETELAQRRLVQALEAFPEGFALYDDDDRLVAFNRRYKEIYAESEDLIRPGAHFEEIIREGARRGQYPEATGRIDAWVTERLERHRSGTEAFEQRLPDGRWTLISERKLPDGGIVGIRADITERKLAEEALRQSEERFRGVFDLGVVGMAVLSPEGYFEQVNQAYSEFLGYTEIELIGKHLDIVIHPADLQTVTERAQQLLAGNVEGYHHERRYRHKDGREVWGLAGVFVLRNPDGSPRHMVVQVQDIDDRKRAEEALRQTHDELERRVEERTRALRESEARIKAIMDHAPMEIGLKDKEGRYLLVNPEFGRLADLPPGQAIGKTAHDIYAKEVADAISAQERKVLMAGQNCQQEVTASIGGERRTYLDTKFPIFDEAGEIAGLGAFGIDITDRKKAEQEVAKSRALLSDAVEALADGFVIFDTEEKLVLCNSRYRETYSEISEILEPGVDLETVARATAKDCLGLSEPAAIDTWVTQRLDKHRNPTGPIEQHFKDDHWILVNEARLPNGWTVGIRTDISELKRREAALLESESRYREIFEESPVAMLEEDWRPVKRLLETLRDDGVEDLADFFGKNPDQLGKAYDAAERYGISQAAVKLYRAGSKEELRSAMTQNTADPDELKGYGQMIAAFFDGAAEFEYEAEEIACDKSTIVTRIRTVIPPMYRDNWSRVLVSMEDITERKRAEIALRQREVQFRQAHEIARLGYWSLNPTNGEFAISPEMAAILGVAYADVVGISLPDYVNRFVHPEDRAEVQALEDIPHESSWHYEIEYRVNRADGAVRWVREVGEALKDEAGEVATEIGTIQDITDSREAEERLRQAQKMEAVGQLTGGVAHDFNNLLAVIMGNAELLQIRVGENDQPLQAVLRAASRGAELTNRLLAFSRQQPLRPSVTNLDEIIADMIDLLARTLGETIEVRSSSTPDLWRALADPGQLESALLNLAINARDAMQSRGTLTIETANVTLGKDDVAAQAEARPGDYVMLAVSDTGQGIHPDLLDRVFEPFFTTKDVGEGTGLGLSMVYGYVKQSGGHVSIYSEEGRGTTVKLLLPRAEGAPAQIDRIQDLVDPKATGETVLVLEDDPDVRALAISFLESLGYQVLEAHDGRSALSKLRNSPGIDLLLSDIVLPGGASGPEVMAQAKRFNPNLKVLFMSGYAENALRNSSQSGLGDKLDLINKPFSKRELARRLREALNK